MIIFFFLCSIGLYRYLTFSWFNFGMWHLSRKSSISYKFPGLLSIGLYNRIWLFFEFPVSVAMPPFSLILLIWILPLSPLHSLARGLSILLIFSKNQLLNLLFHCTVFFVSMWLISALSLNISCCLLLLSEFASFHSRVSGMLLTC